MIAERKEGLLKILNDKYELYHHHSFIDKDPIAVPHEYTELQDIEIAAFFAAILAWGNRTMILRNTRQILSFMDNAPYDFIRNHQDEDLKPMIHFVHRTFNATDLLYFISFFKFHYQKEISLESAFTNHQNGNSVYHHLSHFHHYFFSLPFAPDRTRKHIASPEKKSACKRLNMFLRWMVRKNSPVDFGLWNSIQQEQLICPLDTHVADVAKKLGLLGRKQSDWKAAIELTENLRLLDPKDPARFDYALFGMGAEERF